MPEEIRKQNESQHNCRKDDPGSLPPLKKGKDKWSELKASEKKEKEREGKKKTRLFVFDSGNIYYAHTESWRADGWSSYKAY